MKRYKLSISSFDIVGGVHNYGSVYLDGVKVHECERPDPAAAPDWWTDEDGSWNTIKFDTALEVVEAARKWFLSSPTVAPGDKLVVWSGYFQPKEIKILRNR